jgi:hypothetical protein
VLHHLAEEVVRTEDVPQVGRRLPRLLELAEPQPGLHLTRRAAGGGHQTAGVLGQQLPVHPGPLAVVALEAGPRRQPEQVAQALGVHRQQGEVRVRPGGRHVVGALRRLPPEHRLPAEARVGCDVRLDPDDRRDAGGGGLPVEVERAEQVAVVGHRQRRHAEPSGLGEQVLQPGRPVQHRVLGVHVQVHERVGHGATSG